MFADFNEILLDNVVSGHGDYEGPNWETVYAEILPGEKYICTACGKNYSFKKTLLRHVKFECGGQKRFSCKHCCTKFTQKSNLARHMRRSH